VQTETRMNQPTENL